MSFDAHRLGERRQHLVLLAVPEAKGNTPLQQLVQDEVLTPLSEAMRIKDKGENYSRVGEVLAEMLEALPEDYSEQKGEAKTFFKGLQEKVLRERGARTQHPPGRPQVPRSAPHLD